jgi:hypothetical protein
MPYKILTARLKEFFPDFFYWDGEKVTIKEVKEALAKGLKPIADHYHNLGEPFTLTQVNKTKVWHIRRVIYFIKYPNKIKPIILDNEVLNGYILPQPSIVDGHHRTMAKFILGHKYMVAEYGGRRDVLDYLRGKNNTKPIE